MLRLRIGEAVYYRYKCTKKVIIVIIIVAAVTVGDSYMYLVVLLVCTLRDRLGTSFRRCLTIQSFLMNHMLDVDTRSLEPFPTRESVVEKGK